MLALIGLLLFSFFFSSGTMEWCHLYKCWFSVRSEASLELASKTHTEVSQVLPNLVKLTVMVDTTSVSSWYPGPFWRSMIGNQKS